jgi:hypothetical protein
MAMTETAQQSNKVYREVFDAIQQIYGDVETHRPVHKEYLKLTAQARDLSDEVNIRAGSRSKLGRKFYAWALPWLVRLGRYFMDKGKRVFATDWGKYKASVVTNTDFRKFDDNLRMVISGSATQREKLEQFLHQQHRKGLLVFGLHVSDRALMTCVITDYNLHHIHFVDGADGGYAMAAKAMKKQLKEFSDEQRKS